MWGKVAIVFFFIFSSAVACAQEDAWIYFKDKPNAAYYFNNPGLMLSQRAIDRRAAQNIVLDDKDVPVNQAYYAQVKNAQGITVLAKSKWLNAVHIRGEIQNIIALRQLPFTSRIEFANRSINNMTGRKSGNKYTAVNKVMDNIVDYNYGTSSTQIQMLNGHLLHNNNYTGTGKVIAVLDAGFPGVNTAQSFEKLRQENKILGGYDFVNRSPNFYSGGMHGTLVLSVMGGFKDGQLAGTAPGALYYLFVTEDVTQESPLEESLWVEAAETADSLGVDIINTSLGYFKYDNPAYSYKYEDIDGRTAFISRGADIAFSRGIICVTSAGNTGATENPHIGVPADAKHTLTVGAVDAEEMVTNFSSRGLTADGRIKPDIMALGEQSTVSDANGNISTANGTSFSSPITAGLVACLWQALPNKTNIEIIQLIKESADRFTFPDADYGYGIPDFYLALQKGQGLVANVNKTFIFYPNPVTASTKLLFPDETKEATVIIYNNLGQQVMQQQVFKVYPELNLEALPAGVYYYKILSVIKTQDGKLVKR